MKEIILASGNLHKAKEMQELFYSSVYKINLPKEKVNVVEDGQTFFENALKKAKAYSLKFGKPALADDSGLIVEAMPEKLGVHTARYGGEGLSDNQRWEKLLEEMFSVDDKKRGAYFCCVLCFYFSEDEVFFFEGRLQGKIGRTAHLGEGGFGYDPIFFPMELSGKSLSEDLVWKMENSHRSKAFKEANKFFKNFK